MSQDRAGDGAVTGAPDGAPSLLTVVEVATVLRTSRAAIYTMCSRGQLPGVVRIGRRVLVNRDILVRWLKEGRMPSPGGSRR